MKTLYSLLGLLISMSLLLFFVIGCEGLEGPAGPQGQSGPNLIQISGTVYTPSFSDSTTDARIEIANSPSIPEVRLNDVSLEYLGGFPFRFSHDDLLISHGDTASLQVKFIKVDGDTGVAQSMLALPGAFELLAPEPDTIVGGQPYLYIEKGDSLNIIWSSSQNADEYYMNFYLSIFYWDSLDNQNTFRFDTSAYMQDTCIFFPAATLFPDTCDMDSINHGYGSFRLSAIAGPHNIGDMGNITGDGNGFLYGYAYCEDLRIEMAPDTAGQ